ncbi:MAG: B12-binding domain-containing radical SAM protein [Planctomycetota bacterium]|nr:MAG: B12-binding domain-containing radical SAM protein [Planctomycetota bacterium]
MSNKPLREVLCIYPYQVELQKWTAFPPIGLEYIATVTRDFAERVYVIDCRGGEDYRDFITPRTELVLISWNWPLEHDFVSGVIRSIPARITTIVGGRYATQFIDDIFADFPNVDMVVRGEGEEAMREYLARGNPRGVANMSYREDGKVVHNEPIAIKHVADEALDRSLRRMTYNIRAMNTDLGIKIDSISTSRGCPFNCKFCTFSLGPYGVKRPWAARSPESVVDELAEIRAPIVGIVDDNPTVNMNRVEEICDLILERGINKRYVFNARIDIYRRPALLRKMRRAGFFMACIGIESTTDELLKGITKGFTVKKLKEAWKILRKIDFHYHGYFMLGLLGETLEDKMRIAPFAQELGVDTMGIQILRLEQHSPIAQQVEETPGYFVDENGYIISDEFPIRRMRKIRREISRRFYTPGQMWRIASKLWRAEILSNVGFLAGLGKFAGITFCKNLVAMLKPGKRLTHAQKKQAEAQAKAAAEKEKQILSAK